MKFLRQLILGAPIAALLAQPLAGRAEEFIGKAPVGTTLLAEGTKGQKTETVSNTTPEFKDVYDLIREHLAGEADADLNRDAVLGLVNQLHGKVSLVDARSASEAASKANAVAKSSLFDGPIGYLRVGRVAPGLAGKIAAACKEWSGTNEPEGLVLDLRFADGDDYGEAAAAADLFLSKEKPLLDWGKGVVQSKEKTNALTLTLVVLINAKTMGAAEALAAVLREDGRAILLGSTTAGDAAISQEFPLKSGGYLRIATAAIKVGDGENLSAKGVAPDIHVMVKPEDEQAYFADPYKEIQTLASLASLAAGAATDLGTNGTNRISHPHQLNEADLMRVRKEKPGVDLDNLPASSLEGNDHENDVEKPVVRDPVLGRALDLIKGIAVMRHPRPVLTPP